MYIIFELPYMKSLILFYLDIKISCYKENENLPLLLVYVDFQIII